MKVTLNKTGNWLDSLKFLTKSLEESMVITDEI